MNAVLKPDESVITPNIGGITAPPTIAVQSKAEPFGLSFPNPAMARVNIVGNMMELNNPINNAVQNAKRPVLDIVRISKKMAPVAKTVNKIAGFK